MSCKDNRCKYNHHGITCCVLEKIAILEGGGLLEAGGLLNFSRLRLGAYWKGGGLIRGNTVVSYLKRNRILNLLKDYELK